MHFQINAHFMFFRQSSQSKTLLQIPACIQKSHLPTIGTNLGGEIARILYARSLPGCINNTWTSSRAVISPLQNGVIFKRHVHMILVNDFRNNLLPLKWMSAYNFPWVKWKVLAFSFVLQMSKCIYRLLKCHPPTTTDVYLDSCFLERQAARSVSAWGISAVFGFLNIWELESSFL